MHIELQKLSKNLVLNLPISVFLICRPHGGAVAILYMGPRRKMTHMKQRRGALGSQKKNLDIQR